MTLQQLYKIPFLFFCLAFLFLASCSHKTDVNLAPLYEKKTSPALERQRALGPIFDYQVKGEEEEFLAVRPFYSYQRKGERQVSHYLWPLAAKFQSPDYLQSYYGTFFYSKRLQSKTGEYASWLMPFYFQGRSRVGVDYKALWPIWGTVHDIASYDQISMHLFPLHLNTKKNQTESNAYLWPFISKTKGPGLEKWRYFPFFGGVRKENDYENKWILWPFWTQGKSLKAKHPGKWFFFFPFYGKVDYAKMSEKTILWPFYSKSVSPKGTDLRAPWPFYRKRDYKDESQLKQYWPFWQEHKRPNEVGHYVFWPIYTDWKYEDAGKTIERRYVLPFYWQFKEKRKDTVKSHKRVWPLYSVTKEKKKDKKQTVIRVLDLWPSKNAVAIEKNYAPFWTLYQYQKTNKRTQHDGLWGWFQSDKQADKKSWSVFPFYEQKKAENNKSWSFLKGLISYKKTKVEKKIKLFWFIPTWTSKISD